MVDSKENDKFDLGVKGQWLNPLNPKISMHNLHTALYTFSKVPTRRICLPIKSLFCC